MDLDAIRDAFRNPIDVHEPITSLVMLENTHADSMAQPLPAEYVAAVGKVAHDGGVPLHVDGARIFNASVALGHAGQRAARRRPTRPASACPRAWPARSARWSSARSELHLARAPGAQAARRWHAPGGRAGGSRADRPARRTGRHDRAPRRRPRQRPAPGRRHRRHAGHRRPGSGSRAHELRLLRVGSKPELRMPLPRRARGARAC